MIAANASPFAHIGKYDVVVTAADEAVTIDRRNGTPKLAVRLSPVQHFLYKTSKSFIIDIVQQITTLHQSIIFLQCSEPR